MKFEIQKGYKDWWYRIIAGNGKILGWSRNYTSKKSAERAALNLRFCAHDATISYMEGLK